jgi:hypothetical protein
MPTPTDDERVPGGADEGARRLTGWGGFVIVWLTATCLVGAYCSLWLAAASYEYVPGMAIAFLVVLVGCLGMAGYLVRVAVRSIRRR